MNKYLFLLAWVSGSESGSGDDTRVHNQNDLLSEYVLGNEYIFALRIEAPNMEMASTYGYAEAFHDNYTGEDTTSNCFLIDGTNVPDNEGTLLISVCRRRSHE